ncbi:SIR2 family protein [Mycobacterium colombiense]|uniref:SIR2 family protein n=1 Tax=Mycobacterium colombiense TaxID=339268 RepID=UPI0012DB4C5E|nr:SIR2 family protein [Mycobacterium colombiense]
MAWFGEVEIPDELVEAQQKGELVLFVGAGASIGAPSNLPSFWRLAETIRDESELGPIIGSLEGQALDEVLDKVDQDYDVDVHLRAAKLLSPAASAPNELHRAIADLASSTCVRIVTTNYDRHLSSALGNSVSEYIAPALPVGNEFEGVVYLHGSLPLLGENSTPRKLIITARDFGSAYLTAAWAARFLERMFATYPVLFIGYSHDDVIMKYLARGLGPQAKRRYILTDKPESNDWNQLNITPIGYSPADGHRALYDAVGKWASRSRSGLLDRQRQIKDIVQSVRAQDLSAEQRSYLEATVTDEKAVEFFCDQAQGQDWLDWIAVRSEFRQLFDKKAASTAISWRLAAWFARTYVTAEASDSALAVCRAAGGHLGTELWEAVARQLSRLSRGQELPETMLSWIVLLIRDAPENEPYLQVLLSKSALPADSSAAVALFAYLTEPQLRVTPYLLGGSHFEVRFRGDDHWLRQAWDDLFKPFFPAVAFDLLAVVDQQLRRAQRDVALANGPNAGTELALVRGPIASIGEWDDHGSLALLVDFARDGIESVLDTESSRAESQLAAWADSDVPLLRRLALHGWRYRSDVGVTRKIEWLTTLPWMLEYSYEAEVGPLIAQACDAEVEAVEGFIAKLVAGADDGEYSARRAFRFLHALREHISLQPIADQAIAALLDRHQDLRRFAERASEPRARQPLAPTPEELQDLVRTDPVSALRAVQAQAEQEPQIRRFTWRESALQLTGIVRSEPALGLALLDAVGGVEEHLRSAVIGAVALAWSQCSVDGPTAERFVSALLRLELKGAVDDVALMLMPASNSDVPHTDWSLVDNCQQLAEKCWSVIEATSVEPESEDWMFTAVNDPAGRLATFWIRIFENQTETASAGDGLPPNLAAQFGTMLWAGDSRSAAVQVIFGRVIDTLHRLDPNWCAQHVLPLFSWNLPNRANRAWTGLLSGGTVTDRLLNAGMLDLILTTAGHYRDLQKRYWDSLFGLCAGIALRSDIDPGVWVSRFVRICDLDARVLWMNRISSELAAMPADEVEQQWNRWIKKFWSNRLVSVPRRMSVDEASAIAGWVVYLTDSASEGVELALQHPAGFSEPTLFAHRLSEEQIRRAPNDFARLVSHLLLNTTSSFYGYDLPELFEQFRDAGVTADLLTQLKERALHLGIVLG